MILPDKIKSLGLDAAGLRKIFDKPVEELAEKPRELLRLTCDRIKSGRDRCLRYYKIWAAVDLAFDAPFHQTTPTIIRHVLSRCKTEEDVLREVKSWGLNKQDFIVETEGPDGKKRYELNAKLFHEVLVPIVRAYLKIRLAKIFNERNKSPLFEFEPAVYTPENRVRGEVLTQICDVIARQFGYTSVLRQMIFQCLMYSVSIMFPLEAWYTEDTQRGDETVVEKQGIRYVQPHVTRLIYDLAHPAYTLNTDTGCEYAGYWSVWRWGDVARNKDFWNIDRVPYGQNLKSNDEWAAYFSEVYPCTLEFPVAARAVVDNVTGLPDRAREREMFVYNQNDNDKAVCVTVLFQKLVPSEWGLGDYDKPLWFRFIVGADESVLHVEAFPYRPIVYAAYDADTCRASDASLALEIVPFQDMFANLVTQMLLTIKRNLTNIVFYDENTIDKDAIEKLKIHTHWQYQCVNLIGFDSFKDRIAQRNDTRAAIHEVKFQYSDVTQIMSAFSSLMALLERLLNFSAQELGSQATHQQSRGEIEFIREQVGHRIQFTASFIDEAIDAWKRQLYEAIICFFQGEFAVEISADIPDAEKAIESLGLEIVGRRPDGSKISVKGNKMKFGVFEAITTALNGPLTQRDEQSAKAILMALQAVGQNPLLAQRIDPQSLAQLLEYAARLLGADRNFRIKLSDSAGPAGQGAQQAEQIMSALQEVVQKVGQELQQINAANMQQDQKIEVLRSVLEKIVTALQSATQSTADVGLATPQAEPPIPMMAGAGPVPTPVQPATPPPPAVVAAPQVLPQPGAPGSSL